MREIGVRELRATLSRTLREVSRGQRVRITAHGRPLADIVPTGSTRTDDWLDELVAVGRVTRATKPHGEPPPLQKGKVSASDIILREREAER
jgi:prevent-host-death family protein